MLREDLFSIPKILVVRQILLKERSWRPAQEFLSTILQECDRLAAAPELFATRQCYLDFFEDITDCVHIMFKKFEELKELEEDQERKAKETIRLNAMETRPNFLKELNPWNQFFNKNAPGCPIDTTAAEGSWSQIIPAGGINILADWMERENDHLDEMQRVSKSLHERCSSTYINR